MKKLAILITAMAMVFGACSSESKVGSEKNLRFDEKEAGRLGQVDQATPTPAPAQASTPAPTPVAAKQSTPAPAAPTPVAKTFDVKIIAGGQGFDPFAFSITKGTRIAVTNTTGRSATFTSEPEGTFDSGPIPAGGSFIYTANTAGTFNFKDKERPFAQGQMEVH